MPESPLNDPGVKERQSSAQGVRRAGDLASTKGFVGVTGTITMDADRNPVKPAVILKVEGGRFRFAAAIAPAE